MENSYIRTADPIMAGNTRGVMIQFESEYHLEPDADFLRVEISPDGEDFTRIFTLTGFFDGIERVKLRSAADQAPGDFYLRFLLTTDDSVNYDGVYIDNVVVTAIKWDFSGNPFDFKSETSMAAPVITGIAGLIRSRIRYCRQRRCGPLFSILLIR